MAYGRVEVCKGSQQVALLDGQAQGGHPFFGEMALLDGQPRMASVRTLSPCRLLVLGPAYFFRFLSLVKDFKPRLKRLKELRQKQTELTVLEAQADYSLGGNRTMHEEDVAKMHQLEQRVAARRARGSASEGTLRTPTMSSERMAR